MKIAQQKTTNPSAYANASASSYKELYQRTVKTVNKPNNKPRQAPEADQTAKIAKIKDLYTQFDMGEINENKFKAELTTKVGIDSQNVEQILRSANLDKKNFTQILRSTNLLKREVPSQMPKYTQEQMKDATLFNYYKGKKYLSHVKLEDKHDKNGMNGRDNYSSLPNSGRNYLLADSVDQFLKGSINEKSLKQVLMKNKIDPDSEIIKKCIKEKSVNGDLKHSQFLFNVLKSKDIKPLEKSAAINTPSPAELRKKLRERSAVQPNRNSGIKIFNRNPSDSTINSIFNWGSQSYDADLPSRSQFKKKSLNPIALRNYKSEIFSPSQENSLKLTEMNFAVSRINNQNKEDIFGREKYKLHTKSKNNSIKNYSTTKSYDRM